MRNGRTRDEIPNVRRKYLSPDEARRVIEAAGKVGRQLDRDKLLLTMLFRHGLRLSEAVDLRWSDFDLESKQRTLFVRRLKGSKDLGEWRRRRSIEKSSGTMQRHTIAPTML